LTYAQATGQLSLLPIAIAGGPGVSKSHFIPILIDQAKRRLRDTLRGFDIRAQETRKPGDAVSVCSDHVLSKRYGNLFRDDRLGTTILKTERSDTDSIAERSTRTPMVYRFTFPTSWELLTGRRKCVEFAFRDCAGEEFTEPGALNDYHRYITHAAGILLLIDPTTIPGLRDLLPHDIKRRHSESRPFEVDQIVSRLLGLFDRVNNQRAGVRITTPLAVVLTKADLLRDLEGDAGENFREHESLHMGGFNHSAFHKQQELIRNLLIECGQKSLLSSVEATFKTVGLFAVSALGHEPIVESGGAANTAVQRIGRIQPWRVLDPLVWLFHHYGYVGASRNKEANSCFS